MKKKKTETELSGSRNVAACADFFLSSVFFCFVFQGCSGDERVMGRAVSDVLTRGDKQVVMEGQEPAEFWVALGGKAPYTNDR